MGTPSSAPPTLPSLAGGPTSFSVVYRHPWSDPISIGFRARYTEGEESSFDTTNPTLFGQFTAYEILEPLGSVDALEHLADELRLLRCAGMLIECWRQRRQVHESAETHLVRDSVRT